MNERGREVLVAAAMNGTKQTKGALRRADGSMCAMGVLMDALGVEWAPYYDNLDMLAPPNWASSTEWLERTREAYAISKEEWWEIVGMNNERGWDFLTIARKLPESAA